MDDEYTKLVISVSEFLDSVDDKKLKEYAHMLNNKTETFTSEVINQISNKMSADSKLINDKMKMRLIYLVNMYYTAKDLHPSLINFMDLVTSHFNTWENPGLFAEKLKKLFNIWAKGKFIDDSIVAKWRTIVELFSTTVTSPAAIEVNNTSTSESQEASYIASFDPLVNESVKKYCLGFMTTLFKHLLHQYKNNPDSISESASYHLDSAKVTSFWFLHNYLHCEEVPQSDAITLTIACVYLSGKSEYLFFKCDRLRNIAGRILSEAPFSTLPPGTVPTHKEIYTYEQRLLEMVNFDTSDKTIKLPLEVIRFKMEKQEAIVDMKRGHKTTDILNRISKQLRTIVTHETYLTTNDCLQYPASVIAISCFAMLIAKEFKTHPSEIATRLHDIVKGESTEILAGCEDYLNTLGLRRECSARDLTEAIAKVLTFIADVKRKQKDSGSATVTSTSAMITPFPHYGTSPPLFANEISQRSPSVAATVTPTEMQSPSRSQTSGFGVRNNGNSRSEFVSYPVCVDNNLHGHIVTAPSHTNLAAERPIYCVPGEALTSHNVHPDTYIYNHQPLPNNDTYNGIAYHDHHHQLVNGESYTRKRGRDDELWVDQSQYNSNQHSYDQRSFDHNYRSHHHQHPQQQHHRQYELDQRSYRGEHEHHHRQYNSFSSQRNNQQTETTRHHEQHHHHSHHNVSSSSSRSYRDHSRDRHSDRHRHHRRCRSPDNRRSAHPITSLPVRSQSSVHTDDSLCYSVEDNDHGDSSGLGIEMVSLQLPSRAQLHEQLQSLATESCGLGADERKKMFEEQQLLKERSAVASPSESKKQKTTDKRSPRSSTVINTSKESIDGEESTVEVKDGTPLQSIGSSIRAADGGGSVNVKPLARQIQHPLSDLVISVSDSKSAQSPPRIRIPDTTIQKTASPRVSSPRGCKKSEVSTPTASTSSISIPIAAAVVAERSPRSSPRSGKKIQAASSITSNESGVAKNETVGVTTRTSPRHNKHAIAVESAVTAEVTANVKPTVSFSMPSLQSKRNVKTLSSTVIPAFVDDLVEETVAVKSADPIFAKECSVPSLNNKRKVDDVAANESNAVPSATSSSNSVSASNAENAVKKTKIICVSLQEFLLPTVATVSTVTTVSQTASMTKGVPSTKLVSNTVVKTSTTSAAVNNNEIVHAMLPSALVKLNPGILTHVDKIQHSTSEERMVRAEDISSKEKPTSVKDNSVSLASTAVPTTNSSDQQQQISLKTSSNGNILSNEQRALKFGGPVIKAVEAPSTTATTTSVNAVVDKATATVVPKIQFKFSNNVSVTAPTTKSKQIVLQDPVLPMETKSDFNNLNKQHAVKLQSQAKAVGNNLQDLRHSINNNRTNRPYNSARSEAIAKSQASMSGNKTVASSSSSVSSGTSNTSSNRGGLFMLKSALTSAGIMGTNTNRGAKR